MELKELKMKNEKELNAFLSEQREKLREIRFRDASKQLKNIREIRMAKKMIARIHTVLKSKKKPA
jgi:ribosomal protein L29